MDDSGDSGIVGRILLPIATTLIPNVIRRG
jgi:hypothetical protein